MILYKNVLQFTKKERQFYGWQALGASSLPQPWPQAVCCDIVADVSWCSSASIWSIFASIRFIYEPFTILYYIPTYLWSSIYTGLQSLQV